MAFFATQPINRLPSVEIGLEIGLEFGPMGVGKMSNTHYQGYWAEKWEKSHF